MSRHWEKKDFPELTGVGEVYNTPRPNNRRVAIPGAVGAHICGTEEQFAGHAEYNPDVNVEYTRDGLPLCCGVPETAAGGLLLGGEAVYGYTPPAGGGTCATAEPLALDAVVGHPLDFTDQHWWRIVLPAGNTYAMRVTRLTGSLSTYVYTGGCAGSLFASLVNTGVAFVPPTQPREVIIRWVGDADGTTGTLLVEQFP